MSRYIQQTLLRECHSNTIPLFRLRNQIAIAPKSGNANTPLDQNKRDSGQPRAIVFATHLQYAPALMRPVASDNISMRYPRVFSLNKGDTVSAGNASQWLLCDAGRL
jgi:hypothetical protein